MSQVTDLLTKARDNYQDALDILCSIEMDMIHDLSVKDIMYAYMVACDWMQWIKQPTDASSFSGRKRGNHSVLCMFDFYAHGLEKKLALSESKVLDVFNNLAPYIVQNDQNNEMLAETNKLFLHSLRLTAKFFEDRLDDTHFNKILDEKQVPPIS